MFLSVGIPGWPQCSDCLGGTLLKEVWLVVGTAATVGKLGVIGWVSVCPPILFTYATAVLLSILRRMWILLWHLANVLMAKEPAQ